MQPPAFPNVFIQNAMRSICLHLLFWGMILLGLGIVSGIPAQGPPKLTSNEILKAFPRLKLPLHLPAAPAPGETPSPQDRLLSLELVSELLGPSVFYEGDYIAVGRYRCAGNWILCLKVLHPDDRQRFIYYGIIWDGAQAKRIDLIGLTDGGVSTFCSGLRDAILLQDGKILLRGRYQHFLSGAPRLQYLVVEQPTDSGWVQCKSPPGAAWMAMYHALPVEDSTGTPRFVQLLATESTFTIPSVQVRLFEVDVNGLPTSARDCGIITSEIVPETNQAAFEEAFELKVANGNGGTIHWSRRLEAGTTMLAKLWDPIDKVFLDLRLELIDDCD